MTIRNEEEMGGRSHRGPIEPGSQAGPDSRAQDAPGMGRHLQDAIEDAARLTGACAATLFVSGDDGKGLRCVASVGLPEATVRQIEEISRTGSLTRPLSTMDGPVVYADLSDARLSPVYKNMARVEGISSIASFPLVRDGSTVGFLTVYYESVHNYSDAELETLSLVARLLALAHPQGTGPEDEGGSQADGSGRERFLNLLGHELRTPLTSIMGFTQMIRKRLSSDPDQDPRLRGQIDVVWAQAQRLNRLIDTFVDLAHIEQGSFEISVGRVELVSVLHSAVEQAFAQSGVGSRVDAGLPPQPVWIHGDQRRLEQVFAQLLSNAIRYSPPDSPIKVSLTVRQPEGRAVVEVADKGPGLPPWLHQRVFEPFQEQPSPGTGGLGVGLFLSRTIVEAHGGHISAASPEEGGTIVTVVLPM